jgi:hypothetical protein
MYIMAEDAIIIAVAVRTASLVYGRPQENEVLNVASEAFRMPQLRIWMQNAVSITNIPRPRWFEIDAWADINFFT